MTLASSPTSLCAGIYYTGPDQKEQAQRISQTLSLPILTDTTNQNCFLYYDKNRLSLCWTSEAEERPNQVSIEFVKGATGYRRKHGKKEMLIKAIGCQKDKPVTVLDTTGGMGKDCFLMATYGCKVHVLERNPIAAALLEDGLHRALTHPDTHEIARRIRLSVQDSFTFLSDTPDLDSTYEVIYIDPMFPERNKSALVKKELQLLQKLIGHEEDSDKLLLAAQGKAKKRIVVKRPRTAPSLQGPKPSYNLSGKTTRYDVYLQPRGI